MQIFKNRTVVGIACIILSLVICFAVTPLFSRGLSEKTQIVRVAREIKKGEQITAAQVQTVEVGGYNLPGDVVKIPEAVIGRYASADFVPGDYIIASKVSDVPDEENGYLYRLDGEKQAISVTVKSFANGLSGKLRGGDIVSVIAPDYKKQGTAVILPELKYVEVLAVTAGSGNDANTREGEGKETDAERELPATVTLSATPEQSRILADLELEGRLHLSLVYRGDAENAARFIAAQEAVLEELYPPAEEQGWKETTEGVREGSGSPEDKQAMEGGTREAGWNEP